MQIDADWTSTPDNINALPDHLRRYIHDLETLADPSGMVQALALLRAENEALLKLVEELQTERP